MNDATAGIAMAQGANEYRHKLDYEIDAHGEKVKELVFREPTGADIVRHGNPIRLDLYMNEANMESQMVALAAVPPSTIRQLKARDWNTIAFELTARFFVPTLGQRA
jgi:hypothetical protein